MEIYTTGKLAKICKVSARTVATWFDTGRLKGYRVPGSMDRRVTHQKLVEFLAENDMPTFEELVDVTDFKVPAYPEATVKVSQEVAKDLMTKSVIERGERMDLLKLANPTLYSLVQVELAVFKPTDENNNQ